MSTKHKKRPKKAYDMLSKQVDIVDGLTLVIQACGDPIARGLLQRVRQEIRRLRQELEDWPEKTQEYLEIIGRQQETITALEAAKQEEVDDNFFLRKEVVRLKKELAKKRFS